MWPFKRKPDPIKDYVFLKINEEWALCQAEERCGFWYASPYEATKDKTLSLLYPGGSVDGLCYVKRWRPASARTQEWFCSEVTK